MFQIEFIDILLVIGFVQGLFLGLVLSVTKKNVAANRVLALLMILWAIIPLEIFMVRSEIYYQSPWLIGLLWPVSVALLPSLWLYVSLLLGKPNKRIVWHFTPAIIYYVILLPLYVQSPESKLALLFDSQIIGREIWQLQWMSFVVLAQNLTYLPLAFRKTQAYHHNLEDVISNPEQHNVHWLRLVIITSMVAFLISLFGAFFPAWMLEAQSVMAALIAMSLLYASFRSMTQAQILEEQRIDTPEPEQKPKSYDADFDAVANAVAEKLKEVMAAEQPYLDYDISLSELAEQVGVDRHLLSEVLNQHLHVKFYDFINQYRIAAALSLMQSDYAKTPLTQIASDTGFKSRTTFYNAFKKHTGQTPSQWLKSNIN